LKPGLIPRRCLPSAFSPSPLIDGEDSKLCRESHKELVGKCLGVWLTNFPFRPGLFLRALGDTGNIPGLTAVICGDIVISICFLRVLDLSTEGDAATLNSSDTATLGLIETKLGFGFRVQGSGYRNLGMGPWSHEDRDLLRSILENVPLNTLNPEKKRRETSTHFALKKSPSSSSRSIPASISAKPSSPLAVLSLCSSPLPGLFRLLALPPLCLLCRCLT
jgi:hypothetical protein